jgi:hypothetical protein
MIWVTDADDAGGYRLLLTCSNGRKGVVDLHDKIFNDHRDIVLHLRDPAEFRKFRVEFDTVVWENGLDFAPEYLYGLMTPEAAAPPSLEADSPRKPIRG